MIESSSGGKIVAFRFLPLLARDDASDPESDLMLSLSESSSGLRELVVRSDFVARKPPAAEILSVS